MPIRNVPAYVISVVMHAAVLLGLYLWRYSTETRTPNMVVETVFLEERPQEEFMQEMSIDTNVSQTLSVTSGGAVTGQLGATTANPIARQNIETSDALKEPRINVTQFASISLPGIGDVNMDLGEGEVSGEVGARVDGYGTAMHRLTQELRRMMREQQVIVVWLFDSTESLRSDRQEIAENFNKIYEELNIARQQAEQRKERYHALETVICSFGEAVRKITPRPTADLKEIKEAIVKMPEDKSGKEMIFSSVNAVLDEYGKLARSTNRKLAIVVLTDESGDDPDGLETTVEKSKLYKAPVYILGREAIFGYPYAKVAWKHPDIDHTYWININRGPETAQPEALQYNGFHARDDSASSGFAPYVLARLVKESGGIYFMLQSEEKDLVGAAARLQRKFDDIRMKQYEPGLEPVRDYVRKRDASDFRKIIWQVILRLNPHLDGELNIAWHYPIGIEEFKTQGKQQFQRAVRALQLMNTAITELEKLRPSRELEPDLRWRASYDLVYAQLLAYRVRLFQYLLAMDNHVTTNPKPRDPKSNHWQRDFTTTMLQPTEQQIRAAGVDAEQLEMQRKKALEMYDFIIREHPGTPWAQRAEQEKRWGFGIKFSDHFWDPRYNDPAVLAKVPKSL